MVDQVKQTLSHKADEKGLELVVTIKSSVNDVVVGDPVDDLSIVRCFYEDDVFLPVLDGYREVSELPELEDPVWF